MLQRLSILILMILIASPLVMAQTNYHFDSPSDDQWQYPFSGSVGTQTTGSVFLNAATATFDLRDAIVLVRWDTSAQISHGQEPAYYNLESATVSIWNAAGATWPATTEVQLFGVGYGDIYDASAWNELSTIVAGAPPAGDPDRDPYPINLLGKRVENDWTPTPWAVGSPINYTPGSQNTPFKVEFVLDMQNPVIRAYVQAGLREGHLTFALSTDHLTAGMGEPSTARPDFVMKEGVASNAGSEAAELDVTLADQSLDAVYLFSSPSDDQWQYPFNSTVGTRSNAPVFLTPVGIGFDRRDGTMLVRWDTSSLIKPYEGAENYDVGQVNLRLWHRSTATWGATDTVQIQLFGVGYGSSYDAASWNENSPVVATAPGPPGPARDPYPMTLGGARAENDDTALPWAIGIPIGYDPDAQTEPFAVDFELDLHNPTIYAYVQDGLNDGQLTFAVSTNQESYFGAPPGYDPYFITKEGVASNPGADAPSLTVRLGDIVGNTTANVFDTPVADRWWYPFNGSPGTRERGGIYWENFDPFVGVFNFRGGQDIFKWDTSSLIPTGLSQTTYKVKACRVTVWNTANATWDLDGVNSSGLPKALEIFGLGFGPTYTADTWTETSAFVGANPTYPGAPRDPYPINILTAGHAENVTDELNIDWAVGVPQGYVPGTMTEPFPVTFDIDVNNPTIQAYLQQSLAAGRVFWSLNSTVDAAGQTAPSGSFPDIIMKEGLTAYPGSEAAKLEIVVDVSPTGIDSNQWMLY